MQARTCEVCGKRAAKYVCQECGREVCEVCLEPRSWTCSDCYRRLKLAPPELETFPWSIPFKLFLLGFLIIFIGMIIIMVAAILSGASAGAMIWILPFPPVMIGTGPHLYPLWMVMLAIAVVILGVVLFFTMKKRRWQSD